MDGVHIGRDINKFGFRRKGVIAWWQVNGRWNQGDRLGVYWNKPRDGNSVVKWWRLEKERSEEVPSVLLR